MNQEKVNAAAIAAKELADFMQRMEMPRWSERYRNIENELSAGNVEIAVNLESKIFKGGMGGLYDLYISVGNGHPTTDPDADNELLNKLTGNVATTFSALRKVLKGYAK
ncbi:hypothetical protein [Bacterioplanoides sp.]|uniref:hypothetical protein n=1 Tax=Bacterioplanoides sp. TaxID=2066072 RepID=UPI003B5A37AD